MSNANSETKQATQAPSPTDDGCLTRAQATAELGYPIRRIEGTKLHPVREARGWVFDPTEVAELNLTRTARRAAAPAMSEGRVAACVFYLFDHGRELREVVQEAKVPLRVVRELWHEWLTDLDEGEMERRKTAQSERRRRHEQEEMRESERQSEREQKNFETMMAGITTALGGAEK